MCKESGGFLLDYHRCLLSLCDETKYMQSMPIRQNLRLIHASSRPYENHHDNQCNGTTMTLEYDKASSTRCALTLKVRITVPARPRELQKIQRSKKPTTMLPASKPHATPPKLALGPFSLFTPRPVHGDGASSNGLGNAIRNISNAKEPVYRSKFRYQLRRQSC